MLWDELKKELDDLEKRNLFRKLNSKYSDKIDFKSNDYLRLSDHPEVIEAAGDALKKYGCGSNASRLVCGNSDLLSKLENMIADFKNTESALVFPSGYQTNLGVISAISGKNDFIAADHLSHASLIDSIYLSYSNFRTYPHLNYERLRAVLASPDSLNSRRRFIITDGLFSMDGDIPDLQILIDIAKSADAYLIIDDAHGTGTLGNNGKGIFEYFNLIPDERTILIGTLSKAIGSQGGFIAGKKVLIEYLINKSRPFIFSTGLNPASVAAAIQSFIILKNEPQRIKKLQENCKFLRKLLSELISYNEINSPIIPLIIGEEERTLDVAKSLFEAGFSVGAIRPPTVKPNSARLRISISSGHTPEELQSLASSIKSLIF